MSESKGMTGTHDCSGDASAYVLGALEPAEAQAFRTHLEECAVCRDEVEALEGVVQALPMSVPQHPAPKRVRRRVMRAIHENPKPAARSQRRPSPARSWSSPRGALGALAAAAVVAVAIVGGLELSGGGSSQLIKARVAGISGSAEVRLADGHGELIVNHLSPPPPGHVYEVWLQAGNRPPYPASVLFSVGANGGADVGLPRSLRGVRQVMVTAEPDGGSLAPTHSPVIVAQLT